MNPAENNKRVVIPALDVSDPAVAVSIVKALDGSPYIRCYKIGLELIYTTFGILLNGTPREKSYIYELFYRLDGGFFLDAKLKDIPNTMKRAMLAISKRIEPQFVTVYADASPDEIRAIVENRGDTHVLGVTILTSFDERKCKMIYESLSKKKKLLKYKVLQFADMAVGCGVQGLVCSPQELKILSLSEKFDAMTKVAVGIRLAKTDSEDHKRAMTPSGAMETGADLLVVGRPITRSNDPVGALERMAEDAYKGMKRREAHSGRS